MSARPASRAHAGWWAFVAHRVSGVALALFLPLHFITLGLALEQGDRFASFVALSQQGLVKAAEWGLVTALTVHLALGTRLLLVELAPWQGLRKHWIGWSAVAALAAGAAFAIAAR